MNASDGMYRLQPHDASQHLLQVVRVITGIGLQIGRNLPFGAWHTASLSWAGAWHQYGALPVPANAARLPLHTPHNIGLAQRVHDKLGMRGIARLNHYLQLRGLDGC